MSVLSQNRVLWALAVTACAGAASIAAALVWPQPQTGERASPPKAAQGEAAIPPVSRSQTPVTALQETVNRPLFWPSRRPVTIVTRRPEPEPQAPKAAPPPNLILTGVIIMDGKNYALLAQPGSDETLTLSEGGQVAGWILVDISQTAVIFTQGGQSHRIDLWADRPKPENRRANRRQRR